MFHVMILVYRGENKGLYVLLSRTQEGPGRTIKQEQEDIHTTTYKPLFASVDTVTSLRNGKDVTITDLSQYPNLLQ